MAEPVGVECYRCEFCAAVFRDEPQARACEQVHLAHHALVEHRRATPEDHGVRDRLNGDIERAGVRRRGPLWPAPYASRKVAEPGGESR